MPVLTAGSDLKPRNAVSTSHVPVTCESSRSQTSEYEKTSAPSPSLGQRMLAECVLPGMCGRNLRLGLVVYHPLILVAVVTLVAIFAIFRTA